MKKILLLAFLATAATPVVSTQQFKVITSVESIVPNGLGRSRIINALRIKAIRSTPVYRPVRTIRAIRPIEAKSG